MTTAAATHGPHRSTQTPMSRKAPIPTKVHLTMR